MRTDYRKSSEEIILDLINYHNADKLLEYGIDRVRGNDVIIGMPFAVSTNRTRISITPKPTAPFVDGFYFDYNRVDFISLIYRDVNIAFRVVDMGQYSTSDFVGKINDRWGINIGPNDYLEESISFSEKDYDLTLVLRANPKSLVWTGSIALRITRGIILDSVILRTDLDGFVIPTWQLDTTLYRRNLDGFKPNKP